MYVVPLSRILGKLPLISAGDCGIRVIPRSMHCRKDAAPTVTVTVALRPVAPGRGPGAAQDCNGWVMMQSESSLIPELESLSSEISSMSQWRPGSVGAVAAATPPGAAAAATTAFNAVGEPHLMG